MDDLNLILLAGGYARCTPAWNKEVSGIDGCYKVYAPVVGRAAVEMDDGTHEILPGRVCFISGFRLRRQICPEVLDVYWLHFVPSSLYLRYLLDQAGPFHSWPRAKTDWSKACHREIVRIFGERVLGKATDRLNPPRRNIAPGTHCRIQSLLLSLVATLLEGLDDNVLQRFHPEFYRLKPALDFMEAQYASNPSLEQVATSVHLAPNYFHRRFAQLFGTTPFEYMLARRLNEARRLLSSSSLSIKEVAAHTGYDDPLYFSRLFKARMQLTPQAYRERYAPAHHGRKPACEHPAGA
jgi:AraC-like DNA-binding protein